MRTKTLLLTAVLGVATAATTMADVFSVNVVGYVNKTMVTGFTLVANPLRAATNTVSALFPNPPDLTAVYKFTGAGFSGNSFEFGAWGDPNQTFLPGEGFFVYNPGAPYTNTFVGEVSQGVLTNAVPTGFSLKGSIVPQAGLLQTTLGYVPGDLDAIYQYTQGSGYAGRSFEFGAWSQEPNIGVAEGFFLFNNSAAKNWVRTFTVN